MTVEATMSCWLYSLENFKHVKKQNNVPAARSASTMKITTALGHMSGQTSHENSLLRSILLWWHQIQLTQFHRRKIGSICMENAGPLRVADLQSAFALTQMAPAIRFRKTSCRFSCWSVRPLFFHRACAEPHTVHDGAWVLGGNYCVNSQVFHRSVLLTKSFSMQRYPRLQEAEWGFRKTQIVTHYNRLQTGFPAPYFSFAVFSVELCMGWRPLVPGKNV